MNELTLMKSNIKLCRILLLTVIILTPNAYSQSNNEARQHIEGLALSKSIINSKNFSVCYHYGCKEIDQISLDDHVWMELSGIVNNGSSTPEQERALIAEYIGRMEVIVGRKTNTQFDQGGTFILFVNLGKAKSNQMDCIDESTNSLAYLRLLDNEQLIKYHKIGGLVTRGGISAGYPHTAVLIIDLLSNQKFVVDSWFFDNGRPAVVLPYKLWKAGWKP